MSRLENLLGQPGGAPEEAREEHPDGSWRADALAQSRHARLARHIRQPLDDQRPEAAWTILAEASRNALVDLAPVLVLLPVAERRRCQVLVTFGRMAFDFARQSGVEGERLAALNRIAFTLEQSLDGEPVGQPVYLGMALEEERRPWDRQALDEILDLAMEQAVRRRPATPDEAARRAERLAAAGHRALVGEPPPAEILAGEAAALRVRGLAGLGEGMRRGLATLPLSDLPIAGDPERPLDRTSVAAAIEAESRRVRPLLATARRALPAVPRAFRAGQEYLLLASLALLDEIDRRGWRLIEQTPRLGLGRRLWLLLRARL